MPIKYNVDYIFLNYFSVYTKLINNIYTTQGSFLIAILLSLFASYFAQVEPNADQI